MSRKTKIGLDYFPHDCIPDDSLEYIIALHKSNGYFVYFRLLEKIYNEYGYYMPADDKTLALFVSKKGLNVDINVVKSIINDCLCEHLFDKCIHDKYKMLTSKGIQSRFFEAIKRRKEIEIINEYILIDNVDILLQNVTIKWINVDKSTQSKVKESKVKKSKEKELVGELKNKIPSFDEFKLYALENKSDVDIENLELKYKSWKENGWKTGNNSVIKNWKTTLLNTLPYIKSNGTYKKIINSSSLRNKAAGKKDFKTTFD